MFAPIEASINTVQLLSIFRNNLRAGRQIRGRFQVIVYLRWDYAVMEDSETAKFLIQCKVLHLSLSLSLSLSLARSLSTLIDKYQQPLFEYCRNRTQWEAKFERFVGNMLVLLIIRLLIHRGIMAESGGSMKSRVERGGRSM